MCPSWYKVKYFPVRATEAYGGVQICLHLFLTSALSGVCGLLYDPSVLTVRKASPTSFEWAPEPLRTLWEERKLFPLIESDTTIPRTLSAVASHSAECLFRVSKLRFIKASDDGRSHGKILYNILDTNDCLSKWPIREESSTLLSTRRRRELCFTKLLLKCYLESMKRGISYMK